MKPSTNRFAGGRAKFISAFVLLLLGFSVDALPQSSKLTLQPISQEDWKGDITSLADSKKSYDKASRDKDKGGMYAFVPDATLIAADRIVLEAQRRAAEEQMSAAIAMKKLEDAVSAGKELDQSKLSQPELHERTKKLLAQGADADEKVANYMAAAIHWRLLEAYAYNLLPASSGSVDERPLHEKDNLNELKAMWLKPEWRQAIKPSWRI